MRQSQTVLNPERPTSFKPSFTAVSLSIPLGVAASSPVETAFSGSLDVAAVLLMTMSVCVAGALLISSIGWKRVLGAAATLVRRVIFTICYLPLAILVILTVGVLAAAPFVESAKSLTHFPRALRTEPSGALAIISLAVILVWTWRPLLRRLVAAASPASPDRYETRTEGAHADARGLGFVPLTLTFAGTWLGIGALNVGFVQLLKLIGLLTASIVGYCAMLGVTVALLRLSWYKFQELLGALFCRLIFYSVVTLAKK